MTQAQAPNTSPARPASLPADLRWYDVRDWGVEGKGWSDAETRHYYDRLPARAEGVVREPVWNLSRHSTGLCVRFQTDAPAIAAHWRLRLDRPPGTMLNMTPVASSGLDLYGQVTAGQWRWAGVGRPAPYPAPEAMLAEGLDPGLRAYLLYLPLFDGVESLAIGVTPAAALRGLPPRAVRP